MQAAVLRATGPPEVLKLEQDYPLPQRQPGQVLVRIRSSSVNPVDTAIRGGHMPVTFPKVLGGDLAGEVVEADEGSNFKPGDKVAALTPGYWFEPQDGTYCQFAAVQEGHLAKLPPGVDVSTAGGVPLVALTAWQALMAAKPHQGQRLLVMAAAGGVGHMAVQLGKALGLHVAAVAGPANVAWVKGALGADEVVDYSKQDFAEVFAEAPFDIVVDTRPGNITACCKILKPSGHLSHIMNHGSDEAAIKAMQQHHEKGEGPGASITLVQPNGAQLEEVFQLVAAGQVKLEVAKKFPLSRVAEAHKQVETSHTRGKVVLQMP